MFRFENILDWKVCRSDPNALVVFGDNLIKKGYAGQACIRDEINSFGVPTKRLPAMFGKEAFFSDTDEEYNIVKEKLTYLWNQHLSGRTIILPKQMIGSGLGRLKQTAPRINALVTRFWESAIKAKEQQDFVSKTILVNGEEVELNNAPFETKLGDSDEPKKYLLAENIPNAKIEEFEKLGFGVWIQDDVTKSAVMYVHQDEFKNNLLRMKISKADLEKFNRLHKTNDKDLKAVYELLDFAEREPELWEVVKTINKDKIDYLKRKLNDNTSYYALLISDKSFAYQRFYNQIDMQSALNTPHSPINIQKLALEKVGEKPSFEYGELTDEKFRFIQNILSTQYNQEIVFETIKSAKCSNEAQVFLNHGKPRRNRK